MGNPFHCLTTLTVKKDFLPKVKKKFLVFQSVPLLPVLSLGTIEKGLAPSHPPVRCLCTYVSSPWAFSPPDWPPLSAFPHMTCSGLHTTLNTWNGKRTIIFLSYRQIQELSLFPETENCQCFRSLLSYMVIHFLWVVRDSNYFCTDPPSHLFHAWNEKQARN